MAEFEMTSNRPYLVRAIYEWIVDNRCTPHIVVDARDARVRVPREFVRDGQIVLNVSPSAVGQFSWDNNEIAFTARFGGVPRSMVVPMWAVTAIYARENGEGMGFGAADTPDDEQASEPQTPSVVAAGAAPAMSVVDNAASDSRNSESANPEIQARENQDAADAGATQTADVVRELSPDGDDGKPQPPRGRPGLRVVK